MKLKMNGIFNIFLGIFMMLIITGISCASPVEVINNGGFETGTFEGWTVINPDEPLCPWGVVPPYPEEDHYFTNVTPEGNYMAFNGFDGANESEFIMYQNVTIPLGTATLSWKDSISWVLEGMNAEPRTFEVQIRDPDTNALISTEYTLIVEGLMWDETNTTALPLQSHTVDLSDYAGSTVRLCFVEYVPEMFTGPGHFEIDDISLMVETTSGSDVDIDVNPEAINPDSKGIISVAILGTEAFDVTTVDPVTVAFGPASAQPLRWATDDFDGDGYEDLVFKFRTQETGILAGNTEVVLTGNLLEEYGGSAFEGFDSIITVPPTP